MKKICKNTLNLEIRNDCTIHVKIAKTKEKRLLFLTFLIHELFRFVCSCLQSGQRLSRHAILPAQSKTSNAECVHGAEKHPRGKIAVRNAIVVTTSWKSRLGR